MTKSKANVKDKSQEDRIKSPKQTYEAEERKTTSHRKRKIVTPGRRGTVSIAAIRKVIREVIANRPVSNEN
jgi:hypothetical protein